VASLFIVGWVVMTVAMMLPTTFSLVAMFDRMVRARPDHRALVALLVSGYIGVWTVFGAIAYLGDIGVHDAVDHVHWLGSHPWTIAAATLIGAGAFQFSKLKYRCLDKCRSPFSFITSHWTGRNERVEALRLGVDHGMFCVGCCWALMLVMFAVGVGQLAIMFVLGAVMATEKNHSSGRRLARPVGATLLAWGCLHALLNIV
jgi:predicted metal-binding membrane protein